MEYREEVNKVIRLIEYYQKIFAEHNVKPFSETEIRAFIMGYEAGANIKFSPNEWDYMIKKLTKELEAKDEGD